ncbi:polysaccharide deacetylase family protein [Actinomyces trachealis]|uniref:polysaccharide deacetylase family protein n=1 Tax=Actinomyces trachealis TaxID=2763540 RepID=UPI00189292BA|nr:polysaccharide deacetylase family protein [Actinomyces trachealis]
MQRRDFMLMLAAGTVGALSTQTLTAVAETAAPTPSPTPLPPGRSTLAQKVVQPPTVKAAAQPNPAPTRNPLWLQDGPPNLPDPQPLDDLLTGLPEKVGNSVAITIDDGASTEVVDALLDFSQVSGVRLTFFVTSCYSSWTDCRTKLLSLVESGQVQLANHTVNHEDLTSLSEQDVVREVEGCEKFLRNTYGLTGAPFIRPPYGARDEWTDAVCAKLGYTTPTMWYGTFGDHRILTPEELLAEARNWLLAQHIVIGHANLPTITHTFGGLVEILRERSLQTVTLDDVFFSPGHDRHV